MNADVTHSFFETSAGDIALFRELTARTLSASEVPNAAGIEHNIPIYDMTDLSDCLAVIDQRRELQSEWAGVLRSKSGVVVLKSAYSQTGTIDRATELFGKIIDDESTRGGGDHFAAAGNNDRIWNALQKHCLRDPEGFLQYFGNPAIAAVCEAWLGPNYQMTAQVNQVRPGGQAQTAHRDYHLGFQNAETAAQYPKHAHEVTATLTLQGAVAHCDMPVESGPTKLLPFSQNYAPGYLAFHDAQHQAHFEEAYVQLPLSKGDAVFFNPALFHAAGENRSTDINRMANLLQVSSAFGRAMEAVDRRAMCEAAFNDLVRLKQSGKLSHAELEAAISATAEGYSFPTNLDTDPPIGGNVPVSQADVLRQAVSEVWALADLVNALQGLQERQAA